MSVADGYVISFGALGICIGLFAVVLALERWVPREPATPDPPKVGEPQLPGFLASASLKPFIPDELAVRLISPIQYRPKHGGRTA